MRALWVLAFSFAWQMDALCDELARLRFPGSRIGRRWQGRTEPRSW